MVLIQDLHFIPKSTKFHNSHHCSFKITSCLPQIQPKGFPNSPRRYLSTQKILSFIKPITPISLTPLPSPSNSLAFHENLQTHIGTCLSIGLISFPLPSIAAEITESSSDKINVEAVVNAIDAFLKANPFFVSGLAFIWLIVIPLTEAYLRKYKAISAFNAYSKLRDVPEAQLLDIRKEKSVKFIPSPILKILNKSTVWVEFEEGKEDNFLQKVLERFAEPANTVLCILDNFDGESLKVAELLYKNGFKESYAIKGGVRGKDGWMAIQEKCIPPSAHMFRRKRKRRASQLQFNGSATSNDVSKTDDDHTISSSSNASEEQLNNILP